jgi:hypothetical protein
VQLFSCKATGEFGEWTKSFEGRFSRYLGSSQKTENKAR